MQQKSLPPENVAAIALLDDWLSRPPVPAPRTRFKFFWRADGRWKGELYALPTIRFAWGREFAFEHRHYWIGLYWLQWSIHCGLNEVQR